MIYDGRMARVAIRRSAILQVPIDAESRAVLRDAATKIEDSLRFRKAFSCNLRGVAHDPDGLHAHYHVLQSVAVNLSRVNINGTGRHLTIG